MLSFPSNFTEQTQTPLLSSTTPWWLRHPTHKRNSIHTHKHTIKLTVTCPPTLTSTGSAALRHPHPPPPAPIRREKRMTEDEEKVKMKGVDLVLTTAPTQITIQMVGATMALATPCPTTAMTNLHPGVTVNIVPLRDTQRGVPGHCMTPGSSRRTWCWGGALCPGQLQKGWPRGRAPWPNCSSGSTSGEAWPPRRTSTGRSVERYNTYAWVVMGINTWMVLLYCKLFTMTLHWHSDHFTRCMQVSPHMNLHYSCSWFSWYAVTLTNVVIKTLHLHCLRLRPLLWGW